MGNGGILVSVGLHWVSCVLMVEKCILIHVRKINKINVRTVYQQSHCSLCILKMYFL